MYLDAYRGDGWFAERAKLFQELAEKEIVDLDEVQVHFRKLKAGWLYTDIYVNGELKDQIDISLIFDPIGDMSRWLSEIVDDRKLTSIFEIDEEGVCSIFCFEHLYRAESGCGKKESICNGFDVSPLWIEGLRCVESNEKDWCQYDADICFDYGLFFIYDSATDKITAKAIVKTKDFVNSIYMSFLKFAGFRRIDKEALNEYYTYDEAVKDKWDFYNEMKSYIVEWNMNSKDAFSCRSATKFKDKIRIEDMVFMMPDWGDALFWNCGCCGTADYVWTNNIKYDLTSIEGLREWYDDFDKNGLKWDGEQWKRFYKKGKIFAEKVRELLPDNIDLCYGEQQVKHKIEGTSEPFLLVPNKRMWYRPKKKEE